MTADPVLSREAVRELDRRAIEPHLGPQRGQGVVARLGAQHQQRRIARQHLEHNEHHQRCRQQREEQRQGTADQKAEHGPDASVCRFVDRCPWNSDSRADQPIDPIPIVMLPAQPVMIE